MKTRLFLVLTVCSLSIGAQESAPIDQRLEDDSGFYAECTAYFQVVSEAMASSGQAETEAAYREAMNTTMLYALLLATPGRSQDMAVEVTNARIDLYLKQMVDDIGGRNENISILINRHHSDCIESVETPRDSVSKIAAELADTDN